MAYQYRIVGKQGKAKGLKLPPVAQAKVPQVMDEFSAGTLRSGKANGPVVTNPKQALAIALNQARKTG